MWFLCFEGGECVSLFLLVFVFPVRHVKDGRQRGDLCAVSDVHHAGLLHCILDLQSNLEELEEDHRIAE